MAKIGLIACDKCGKRTDDAHDETGWILLNGSIALTGGRHSTGDSMTGFIPKGQHEFCSVDCLVASLKAKLIRTKTNYTKQAKR